MLEASRRRLLIVCILSLVGAGSGIAEVAIGAEPPSSSPGGAAPATEDLRSEEIGLQRIDAKSALTIVRSMAGIREIEIVDAQTIRIRSSPEKLLLAHKVLDLAAGSEDGEPEVAKYEVGDGTHVAAVALRHTSACDAQRMLMSTIGIRRVACIEENETVVFRDTQDQVKAAFDLLEEFDRVVP